MTPNNIVLAIVAAVIAVRMYSRMRRNIGRQPLQPKRLIARIVVLAVITAGIAIYSIDNSRLLMGLGGGLAVGALLALVGLRLTQFEDTAEGRFFTPNAYIGIALTILFMGRLIYRLTLLSSLSPREGRAPALMQSPLSFFIFELLAGYYIAYYLGILRRRTASA